MNQWTATSFVSGDNKKPICSQLRDYLNEEQIEDFRVVQMEYNYLEIIYKTNN